MSCEHEWKYETDRWDIPVYRKCGCGAEQWKHYISADDINRAPWSDTPHRDDAIAQRKELQ